MTAARRLMAYRGLAAATGSPEKRGLKMKANWLDGWLYTVLVCCIGIAAVAATPQAARGQSGCAATVADSLLLLEWVQGITQDPVSKHARQVLGLSHLEREVVMALGGSSEEDAICSSMYAALHADIRADLEMPVPEIEIAYFKVGDRYLLYYGPKESSDLWSAVVSYDEQFNVIGRAGW